MLQRFLKNKQELLEAARRKAEEEAKNRGSVAKCRKRAKPPQKHAEVTSEPNKFKLFPNHQPTTTP